MATRLATAAVTCSSLPNTSRPGVPPVTMSIRLESASIALVSTATPMTSSMLTAVGVSSGSSAWSRDSSMICCTSRESRSLSVSIRPANRLTASGSSLASATASASSLIAPTGVFSSWLTLATKSRRTASTRRSRVRSSTRASTRREPSGATRAVTCRAGAAARSMSSSVSRIWPSRRTSWTSRSSSSETSWVPRTSPRAYAGAEAFTTVSVSSTITALLRSTERTVATSGGTTGSSCAGSVDCWRSLMCHASTAPPATTAPRTAARNACVVGSTPIDGRADVARRSLPRGAGHRTFMRSSRRRPGWTPCATYGGAMREALPRPARVDLRRPRRDLLPGRGGRLRRHRGAAQGRRRDRRAGHQRRRGHRPGPRAGRGHGVLPALAPAAGRRRPAGRRRGPADGDRARADGRPLRPRRQDRPAPGAQHRGARGDPADHQPDGRGRRGHGQVGARR